MTETVVSQRITVSATGFSNPINLPANAEEASHVKVYGDDTLLGGGDYTLDGVGDTGDLDEIAGVDVTIDEDVLVADLYDSFTVEHVPPLSQGEDLSSGGTLGRIYEAALDAIMRRVQSLGEQVLRRLVLPVSASDVSTILPHPEARRALIWNEAGDALVNSFEDPDNPDTVDASAFADASAASAAAAAATLALAEAVLVEAEAARDAALAAQNAAEVAAAQAGDPEAIAALAVPVGTTILHDGDDAPTGYLKENGAVVSQTTYAALYAEIGDRHNTGGEGAGNFRLPESRAEFIRCADDGRGVDSGRTVGSLQSEMIGPHSHVATAASAGSHSHTTTRVVRNWNTAGDTSSGSGWDGGGFVVSGGFSHPTNTTGSHTHDITVNNNTGTENRPRNTARLACIKYLEYVLPE